MTRVWLSTTSPFLCLKLTKRSAADDEGVSTMLRLSVALADRASCHPRGAEHITKSITSGTCGI